MADLPFLTLLKEPNEVSVKEAIHPNDENELADKRERKLDEGLLRSCVKSK
ncbi:hypothetical protein ACEQPO_25495 [Bacillus sp. SL00103]